MPTWIRTIDGEYVNADVVERLTTEASGFTLEVEDEAGHPVEYECHELIAVTATGHSYQLALRLGADNASRELDAFAARLADGTNGVAKIVTSSDLREAYADNAQPF